MMMSDGTVLRPSTAAADPVPANADAGADAEAAASGLLLVVIPASRLRDLGGAHIAGLSAVARCLGAALRARQVSAPSSRLASSGGGGSLRPAAPRAMPSAYERVDGDERWAPPTLELPSLAAHLAGLMEELEAEQAASLGKMLTQHPQLGDAVIGHLARRRAAEQARAAQEAAAKAAAAERQANTDE